MPLKTSTKTKTPARPRNANPARATECKAQDKAHCPYHVAENRALAAFERGDLDAAFKFLYERDRNKRVLRQEQAKFEQELLDAAVREAGDTSLEHATYATRRAHLEQLIEAAKLPKTSKLHAKLRRSEVLDLVAQGTPQETMYDILKRAPGPTIREYDKVRALRELTALWQDTDSLKGPERNVLHPDSAATGTERAMAQLLMDEGSLLTDGEGSYGWKDTYSYPYTEKTRNRVEAILDVAEDDWYEFVDTYNGSDHNHGLTGTTLLADGTVHKIRVEAELGQLMQWVAKQF